MKIEFDVVINDDLIDVLIRNNFWISWLKKKIEIEVGWLEIDKCI